MSPRKAYRRPWASPLTMITAWPPSNTSVLTMSMSFHTIRIVQSPRNTRQRCARTIQKEATAPTMRSANSPMDITISYSRRTSLTDGWGCHRSPGGARTSGTQGNAPMGSGACSPTTKSKPRRLTIWKSNLRCWKIHRNNQLSIPVRGFSRTFTLTIAPYTP